MLINLIYTFLFINTNKYSFKSKSTIKTTNNLFINTQKTIFSISITNMERTSGINKASQQSLRSSKFSSRARLTSDYPKDYKSPA